MTTTQLPALFAAQRADGETWDTINREIERALDAGDLATADVLLAECEAVMATVRARSQLIRQIAEGSR